MSFSTQTADLYKSRKNLIKQLKYRGYQTDSVDTFSINEIHIMNENDQLDFTVTNEKDEKVHVKYVLGKAVKDKDIYDSIEELFELEEVLDKKTDQLLIVSKSEPNDTIVKFITNLFKSEGYFVTIISVKRLLFNILQHTLVPEHRIMTTEEKTDIKKKYNITDDTQFPEISRFDPVATVLGVRPGQVCEITRKSSTALESKYYRVCI